MIDLLDALAKPPPPSELDELMQRDPLELSAQDIDKIIAFQRQARARRETGGPKTKRATKDGPPSGIDLLALVTKQATPAPTQVTPASSGGFRRI